jgi:hypothetical protein
MAKDFCIKNFCIKGFCIKRGTCYTTGAVDSIARCMIPKSGYRFPACAKPC